MVSKQTIHSMGRQIGREFQPERVLLFGSHAWGVPGPESDVDLLVIVPCKGATAQKAAEIRLSLDHSIPIDVLVRTPEDIKKRLTIGDDFIREIIEKGTVIYERDRR
jgi:predicted nucleotidyltransferase